MSERTAKLGQLEPGVVSNPWIIVFGGVTRKGNRRARRAASRALSMGMDVVWFDGYEESDPRTGYRLPLDIGTTTDASAVVVGFKHEESVTLAGRLRVGGRARHNGMTRWLWTRSARRMGNLMRARSCWSVIRADVLRLKHLSEPTFIVFADDHTLTSAWYAGRVWKSAPICSSLPVS